MNRYAWNVALIEVFTRMSLWGIPYDRAAATALRSSIEPRLWEKQAAVDMLAGIELPESESALLRRVADKHCHKTKVKRALAGYAERTEIEQDEADLLEGKRRRKKFEKRVVPPQALSWALCERVANEGKAPLIQRIRDLAASGLARPAQCGEMAALLGLGINVESPDDVLEALDRAGLPAKWKRGKHDPENPESGRTADEDALLDLFVRTGEPITKAILEARGLRGAASWLDTMQTDDDGRVRCSFANPGSETGRVLSRKWHSRSGGNLQAVSAAPINFRVLLTADLGKRMAQCDLKGADGWTVAARCAQQGDPTMLLDLQAGIRIPSLLALLMGGATFAANYDRVELRKLCKAVVKDWRDYAFKKAQHLSNYMGSAALIQRETVRESWSETGTPTDPGKGFCERVQGLYLGRYWGLKAWWADCERQVRRCGTLEGASGQVREFLSRRWAGEGATRRLDHGTLKEVVASEPQMLTTYATNLALWRLWTDPENWEGGRVGDPRLTPHVQPLLHIHDALLVQFDEARTAWAGVKLAQWFNNPVRIGNVTVTIPVEMAHGPNWGACETPF